MLIAMPPNWPLIGAKTLSSQHHNDEEFKALLQATFMEEAVELLDAMEQSLLALEANHSDLKIVEEIFRSAHSIKGSSRAVGLNEIGEFTHDLESLLHKVKAGQLPADRGIIDILLASSDHLRQLVQSAKSGEQVRPDEALRAQIQNATTGARAALNPPVGLTPSDPLASTKVPTTHDHQFETKRQSPETTANLGFELFDTPATPVTPATATSEHRAVSVNPVPNPLPPATAPKDENVRVSLSRLGKLVDLVGELVILQTVLEQQKTQIPSPFLQKTVTQLSKITKDIQDVSMSLRMVSLKPTFQKLQRIVRDTAQVVGKQVKLDLSGEETEIDKNVVDSLGDPLVHLLRNAVDHGIESREEREKAGKSAVATVQAAAFQRGGKIVIEVRDDGRGLDPDKLRAKGIEKGIIKPNQKLSDNEACHLIFHPGFSTKSQVTEISGRGVGLDVVKTNVEKLLQGEVEIESILGQGTTFRITLPLTLAIIDGMVIRSATERYVVPLIHVYESLRPKLNDIHHVTGVGDILHLRGENLPLRRLSTLLGTRREKASDDFETAIVVRTGNQPFAIMVDEIIGHQQVVIKNLGAEIGGLRGISGGAILGDGAAALILDLADLVSRSSLTTSNQASIKRGAA
jgi:two-component system, chemotaxis family, sensor kinase CheA